MKKLIVMASGSSGEASGDGTRGSNHLLVVIVDLCDAYRLSTSFEDLTQRVLGAVLTQSSLCACVRELES